MKKKLIIATLLFGTFTFTNAQSIGDISKTANTATKTATTASTFNVATISNQVMGLLSPKLKLTNAQTPAVTSLVNETLNKKKTILSTKTTEPAAYTSKMTATRESFITKIKKLITPAQLQALTPLLPKSAQSLTPLAQMLF